MRRALEAAALALLLGGCASLAPASPDPLPPERSGAAPVGLRVDGIVTDRWGYLVPDAWITVRVGSPRTSGSSDPECAGASHLPTRTRGGATGAFSVVVEAGRRDPFDACLEVEALPPRGTGLRENRVIVPTATFTTAGAGGGGEVLRVHVVLY